MSELDDLYSAIDDIIRSLVANEYMIDSDSIYEYIHEEADVEVWNCDSADYYTDVVIKEFIDKKYMTGDECVGYKPTIYGKWVMRLYMTKNKKDDKKRQS